MYGISEEKVKEISAKILKKTTEFYIESVKEDFHDSVNEYLYEQYENHKEDVEKDLIKTIVEDFVENPKDSKYYELRKKLFKENEERLSVLLTEELIEKSVEKILIQRTNVGYVFKHLWDDAIAKVIFENIDKFAENSNILRIVRKESADSIREYKQQIEKLKTQLKEMLEFPSDKNLTKKGKS